MTTYALNPATDGLKYQVKTNFGGTQVVIKNATNGYVYTTAGVTPITDLGYPSVGSWQVTLTSSGTTASATTTSPQNFTNGSTVTIAGANQANYNGSFVITVIDDQHFTYTMAGSAVSPATGSIVATGGPGTVPGLVFLDGYFFVQTISGNIQNSELEDPTTWPALGFVTPEKEPSNAVAIAKSLNYLVAFKQWDTEFYYDAANPSPGSPLSVVDSAYLKLGCATADSIVEFDGGIVLMTKRDNGQRSREIHILNGLTPQKLSTPEVERILNGDDLAKVYSLYISTAGHQFYVLTLTTVGVTVVYDFSTGLWYCWSVLSAQASKSVTALTSANGISTATVAAHGYLDGDPVTIAGADQNDYNITANISYVDANTFTFEVENSPVTPATGTITATGYDEGYWNGVSYANYNNLDLVLGETDGIIYSLDPTVFLDNLCPINASIRTANWDNGNQYRKTVNSIRLIGDRVDSDAVVRYSDDDYQSYSKYRTTDLSVQSAAIRKLGYTRRRAYEIKHTANTSLRLEAIEQDFIQGH